MDKWEIQIDEELSTPKFTISSYGIGCAPRGDIIAIKAKSKNGKTFLASIFASVILGAQFGGLKSWVPSRQSKVLYFDTEQNKPNTQALMIRIHKMCGWGIRNNRKLHVFYLREMPLEERMGYIKDKVKEHRPVAVFIDGLADLIPDFNDVTYSQDIIQEIMSMSSMNDCAVFFVLHTNKNDNNMQGHLGTYALKKCADVFCVERDKTGVFHVSETDSRNVAISNFDFVVNEDKIPVFVKKQDKS